MDEASRMDHHVMAWEGIVVVDLYNTLVGLAAYEIEERHTFGVVHDQKEMLLKLVSWVAECDRR